MVSKTIFGILIVLIVSFWFILTDFNVFHNLLYVHVPILVFEILALHRLKKMT